jgi:hypothetical protein
MVRQRHSPETKFCEAHRQRRGSQIPAEHIVAGEAMCSECFRGTELESSPGRAEAPGRAVPSMPGARSGRRHDPGRAEI